MRLRARQGCGCRGSCARRWVLVVVIQHVSDEIRRYDKRILPLAEKKYPPTERLRSARGVGPLTSLAFVLHLDNNPHGLRRGAAPGQWSAS